jgi:hypothetical protein
MDPTGSGAIVYFLDPTNGPKFKHEMHALRRNARISSLLALVALRH